MGMPLRARTYFNIYAKGGITLSGSADPKAQNACIKGDLNLQLNLLFKFTWFSYPGVTKKGWMGICEGFLNSITEDMLKGLPLPIDPIAELCKFSLKVVPTLDGLKSLSVDVPKINLYKKDIQLFCGTKCGESKDGINMCPAK